MPDEVVPVNQPRKESEEHQLSILLQKVIGDNTPPMTEAQMTEILSQRREISGYIHEDRKRDSYDKKFILVGVLAFILVFSSLVLWKKPDIFSEVLSLIVGLLGGGAGGYGIGKSK